MKAAKLTLWILLLTIGVTLGIALFGAGMGELSILKVLGGLFILLTSLKLLGRIKS